MSFNRHRTAATTQRRLAIWVGGALVIIGCIAIARGVMGAEIDHQRPHEIIAVRSGAYYSETRPNTVSIRLPDQQPYASRFECEQAIRGARVDKLLGGEPGWRLRCDLVQTLRVN